MAQDIVIRFTGDAASAIRASRQTSAAISGVEVVGARAGRSIATRLGGALAGFAKVGILAATGVSTAFAGMTIYKGAQRAIAIDDAERKLEGLGYTAQQVAQITDNALKAVLGTPYALAQAMTVATTAIAAGIQPGKDLSKYLALVADTATITGGSLEEIGSVLNKATANQRVYTDVLNQLADRGLPVFSWLQKEYDVSGAKLRKMVQDGEVDSRHLLKVIRENIGGAAQKAGEGIRGSFANLITAIARLGDALVGPIFGSVPEFLQSLRGQVDTLAEHIRPIGERLGKLFKAIQDADGTKARILLILDAAKSGISELLFGKTRRVKIPIEGGRFEWTNQQSQGLVDAIAKGIEAVDWSAVTKAIVKGLIHAAGEAAVALHDWAQENVTPESFIRLVGLDPDHDYGHDIDQFVRRQLSRFLASFKPNWGNLRNLGPVPFGDEIRRSLSAVVNWIRSRWRGLLVGAVRSGFAPLPGLARAALDRARAAITSRVASWGAAAARLAERVVTAIDNRLGRLPSRVGRYIARAATEVGRHISEFFRAAVMLGEAIVNGIISGLGNLFSRVGSAIANQVHSAIDWAKGHIGSTASQYAQVQLGDPIMQGIVNGVNQGQPILAAALRRAIHGAINRAGIDRFSQIAQQIFSGRQAAAMTPAERQIAAIERRRELDQLQSALTDALAGGDRAAIAAAQEDIRLFQLREQAERQRAALEQRQFLASLRFQSALERLTRQIEKGNLTAAQERRRVRRFVHEFNLNIKGGGLSRADKAQLAKELGPYMSQAIGYVVEAQ